jgi:hypothetical protein
VVTCVCRLEQLQASLTAQAANQASLEEQLADAQERLAMEDGNKVRFAEDSAPACARCPDMHTHRIASGLQAAGVISLLIDPVV